MDYKELAKSLLCNGSGVGEDINGCTNKKCKYRDGDGGCNLTRMCGDAAIAINELLTENQALRNAANGFNKQAEAAEARAEKAEGERNTYKIFFDDISKKPDCNTCSKKECEYRPGIGKTTRFNCPLWCGHKEE